MRFQAAGRTDVGRKRASNEDHLLVDHDLGLYIVSDGLGGHAAGEVASQMAVSRVANHLRSHRGLLKQAADLAADPQHKLLTDLVLDALRLANQEVHALSAQQEAYRGLACTLTMLLTVGARAVMAHVGDCRLYMVREGKMYQLSSDHTVANEMIASGALTLEQAETSPYTHQLTRSLGHQADVIADTLVFDVLADDLFILCSDGLTAYADGSEELMPAIRKVPLEDLPEKLVDIANQGGGRDNITVVVVHAHASPTDRRRPTVATPQWLNAALNGLARTPMFNELLHRERLKVFNIAQRKRYERGELVLGRGQICAGVYVVIDGELVVQMPDGTRQVLKPGDSIGSRMFLNNKPFYWDLLAHDRCDVLLVPFDKLRLLLQERPFLAIRTYRALARFLTLQVDQASRKKDGLRWQGSHPE